MHGWLFGLFLMAPSLLYGQDSFEDLDPPIPEVILEWQGHNRFGKCTIEVIMAQKYNIEYVLRLTNHPEESSPILTNQVNPTSLEYSTADFPLSQEDYYQIFGNSFDDVVSKIFKFTVFESYHLSLRQIGKGRFTSFSIERRIEEGSHLESSIIFCYPFENQAKSSQ